MSGLERDAQAGLVHDKVPPKARPLIAGVLHGVVTVNQVADLERNRGIHVRAVPGSSARLGQGVGRAPVDRDPLVCCARVPAPDLAVQLSAFHLGQVLVDEDLHHAVFSRLAAGHKFGMQRSLGRVDAKATVVDRVAVLDPRLVPVAAEKSSSVLCHGHAPWDVTRPWSSILRPHGCGIVTLDSALGRQLESHERRGLCQPILPEIGITYVRRDVSTKPNFCATRREAQLSSPVLHTGI